MRSDVGLRSRTRARAVLEPAVVGLAHPSIMHMTMAMMLVALAMHLLLAVHLLLPLMLAIGIDQPIIVLGVLVKVFGGDTVAGGGGVARQRQILLQHLVGVPANADIRPAAVEGLRTDGHVRFTAVITATLALHVWTGSHNT